jgi:phosphatidylinositol alpha-1,6-mannosyltransferase
MSVWYWGFAVYAGAVALFTGHADRLWAVWAVGAYALAALMLRLTRNWVAPMVVALGGALVAPTAYLVMHGPVIAEVEVIGRSAALLLRHGTPYLPVGQLTQWTSYNPYLPVMEIFGLPGAAGFKGLAGDPRLWLTLFTMVLLALALGIMAPDNPLRCADCRKDVIRQTGFALASPVIAFPLALGITDPPIIALLCVALACAARGWILRAGLLIGSACAMKYTAWPAVPVFAAMVVTRYKPRIAARFVSMTAVISAGLAVLAAPEAMASPSAVLQNTVAFPLGLAKHRTPAASSLPGHVLADLGTAGHWTAVGLMLAAGISFAIWLVVRPPQDVRAVAWRLALGYALMFTLAPATRWGYFAYPLGLLGWLALTRTRRQPSTSTTTSTGIKANATA